MDNTGVPAGEHTQCRHRYKSTAVCCPQREGVQANKTKEDLSCASVRHKALLWSRAGYLHVGVGSTRAHGNLAGYVRSTLPAECDPFFERMVEWFPSLHRYEVCGFQLVVPLRRRIGVVDEHQGRFVT